MKKIKIAISSVFVLTSFAFPFLSFFKENRNYDIDSSSFNISKNTTMNNVRLTIPTNNSGSIMQETIDFGIKVKENFVDINSLKDLSKNKIYFNEDSLFKIFEFDFKNNSDESKKTKIKNYSLNLLSILYQAYFNVSLKKVSFYKTNNELDNVKKEINFFENSSNNITSKKMDVSLIKDQNKIKINLENKIKNTNDNIVFELDAISKVKANLEVDFINQLNNSIKSIDVESLFSFSLDNLDVNKNYYTYSYDMFANNGNNNLIKTLMFAINKPKINQQNSQEVNNLISKIESIDINVMEKNGSSTPNKEYKRKIMFSKNEKIDYSFLDLPFDKDVVVTNIKINTKDNNVLGYFLNSSNNIEINLQTQKDKLNRIHLSNSINVNVDELYKKIDESKSLSENLKIIENEIKNNPLSIKFFEYDDLKSLIDKNNNKKYDEWYKSIIQKAFDKTSDWYQINLSYIYVDSKNKKGYIRLIIKSNDGKELINTFIKKSGDSNAPNSGGSSSSNGNSTSGNNSIVNGNQDNIYQQNSNSSIDKWIIYVGVEILLIIVVISIIAIIINKNKNKEKF